MGERQSSFEAADFFFKRPRQNTTGIVGVQRARVADSLLASVDAQSGQRARPPSLFSKREKVCDCGAAILAILKAIVGANVTTSPQRLPRRRRQTSRRRGRTMACPAPEFSWRAGHGKLAVSGPHPARAVSRLHVRGAVCLLVRLLDCARVRARARVCLCVCLRV